MGQAVGDDSRPRIHKDARDEEVAFLLAGLIHFTRRRPGAQPGRTLDQGGAFPDLSREDVEFLGARVAQAALQRAEGGQQWFPLFVPSRFFEVWRDGAKGLLDAVRHREALGLFREEEIVGDTADVFAARLREEERKRARQILVRTEELGIPLGRRTLEEIRRKLAHAWLMDKGVRLLPAVFLLLAAAVALVMLLRVLKLPL
jgi:hypothetical protein